eukprot:CAMPEP_0119339700 /NCGR_PEP_ID=MMETSP1333-20130426/98842_1 /TAXON_ID=418940 /ORGANISM="Scyphosphaera apsteinii, Strain RCC1455" /LENGTH=117 /DNA_ID=CAMNT_0007351281 /DNA_START=116 /DNA_END=469 /DNA_ORIENTATION=+
MNDAWWGPPGQGFPRAPMSARALGYSLRTERYRFTQWVRYINKSKTDKWAKWTPTGESIGVDLFDYKVDPGETNNIAAASSSAELVRQLAMTLRSSCKGCERLYYSGMDAPNAEVWP